MKFVYHVESIRNVAEQYMKLLVADIMCHRPMRNGSVVCLQKKRQSFLKKLFKVVDGVLMEEILRFVY